jgi:hypothetical protein
MLACDKIDAAFFNKQSGFGLAFSSERLQFRLCLIPAFAAEIRFDDPGLPGIVNGKFLKKQFPASRKRR